MAGNQSQVQSQSQVMAKMKRGEYLPRRYAMSQEANLALAWGYHFHLGLTIAHSHELKRTQAEGWHMAHSSSHPRGWEEIFFFY